jgi:hypothetical protein
MKKLDVYKQFQSFPRLESICNNKSEHYTFYFSIDYVGEPVTVEGINYNRPLEERWTQTNSSVSSDEQVVAKNQ